MATQNNTSLRAWRALTVLLGLATASPASEPLEGTKIDCGVNALFLLHQLEGRDVTFDRLEAALPAPHRDGFSMAELAAASGSLGLPLEGQRFGKGDRALDRPAIAFLRDAKGGHFLVLRPVGTTATRVQVIDPPYMPRIADYDQIHALDEWQGRILIPRDPWYIRYRGPGLAVLAVSLLVPLANRTRSWRERSRPGIVEADKAGAFRYPTDRV